MRSTLTRALVTRALVVCAGLAIAGSAAAQSTAKDRAADRQGSAKSPAAQLSAAPKRLDFVPGNSVKETAARSVTPATAAPGHTPAKQGSGCESGDSDA